VRQSSSESPACVQSKQKILVRQDVIPDHSIKSNDIIIVKREKPQHSKKIIGKQETVTSTPTPVAAKPATKRKAESSTPPPKITAKYNSTCEPVRLTISDGKITGKNGSNAPTSQAAERGLPTTKPKRQRKPTGGAEKQLTSPLQYFSNSPKPPKAKRQPSAWVKPDKGNPKIATSVSPVAGGERNSRFSINYLILFLYEKSIKIPFLLEITDLLIAFGDSSEPLSRSVQMMETVLKHEMAGFICICEQKAMLRGVKTLGITEAVLALKGNIPRMTRMYKHFGKQIKQVS